MGHPDADQIHWPAINRKYVTLIKQIILLIQWLCVKYEINWNEFLKKNIFTLF